MNNITKPIITGFVLLICITLLGAKTKSVTNEWTEEELSYALRTATQDATACMLNENYTIDGNEGELQNVVVDIEKATDEFEKSFALNIGAFVDPANINSMNIPLSGYVGYKQISGILSDGSSTQPYAYTYVDSVANKMYSFTLGDIFYSTNLSTYEEQELKISELPEHYFHAELINENFKTTIIMESISDFLTQFCGTEYDLVAYNVGSGLSFELGKTDYSQDPSMITEFAAVIDGPGYFAVADLMDPQLSGIPIRTFTFGGAELVSKY